MSFLDIYVNIIRGVFLILTCYYLFKRDFMKIKSTIIVILLTFIPYLLDILLNIKVDSLGLFLFYSLNFMTVYFGSALDFYDKYAWWDRTLHVIAGVTFVSFGIAISDKAQNLDKFEVLFFSFTFSLTIELLWEIIEYISDRVFHTNAQRWKKKSNTRNRVSKKATQSSGHLDTMNDMICYFLGTTFACVVWWYILQ